ncbi:MAG: hypothetical protein JHC93_08700, partial [Parachlamydiales bacterium]|nr:hypothetical protein [Parachlamydiales bacterium]
MSSIPPIDPNQFNNPSQKVIPQQPKIQIPKNTSQRLQTQSEIEDLYKCLQVINKFQQTSVEKKFIPSPEKILQAKEFFSLYDIYYFLDTTILHIIEIEVDRCLTNIIKHRYRTEDQLVFHSIIKMHLYPEALLTQLQKDFSIVCTYLLENKFELAKKELEFFKIHFSKYKSLLVNKAIIKTDLVQTLDINIDSLEILFLSGEDQIQFVMQPLDKKYVTYNNEYLKNILLIMVQSQHRYIEFFKNLNLSRCNIILEQEWIKNLNHEKYSELKTSIESCCNEANKLQTCHNEWNNAVSVVLEGFRNIIEFVMSNDKFVFGHTFKTQFYLDFVIFTQNFEKYIEETKANICSVVEAQVKFDEQKLKTIDSFNELSSTSKTNNTPIKFLDLDRLTKYSDRLVQVWISRSETLANTTWMSLKTCQLHSLMLLRDIETFNDLIECTDPKGSYVCRLDLVCNKLILYYRRCNPVFKQSISIDNAKWKTYLMVEELFNSIVHLIKLLYDFTKKFNDSQVLNRTDLNFIVERKKQYYKILKKRENYFKTKDFVETEQIKSFYNFVKYIFIIMENPCVGVTYFIGPGDYARKCSFYNPNIKAAYIFLREYGISNFQNMSEFPLFKTYVTIVKNQKKAFFKAVPTTKFYKLLDELELILKTFPKIVEEVIQKSKSCNELVHEVFNIYYNHQPNLLKICISLKKESISYPLEKLDSIIEFGFQGEGSLYHYIN